MIEAISSCVRSQLGELLAGREPGELRMRPGVVADLHAGVVERLDRVGVRLRVRPHHEERGDRMLALELLEDVQRLRGPARRRT